MKKYEKKYEDFFKRERTFKRYKIDKMGVDGFETMESYQDIFKNTLNDFQLFLFDYLVKIRWLLSKFRYNGMKMKDYGNAVIMDVAFSVFGRYHLGFDFRLIRSNPIFVTLMRYIDEFFPDLDDSNPFEKEFKYPFKHMNFECLMAVHRLPERLELLKQGEEEKMQYNDFINYVVNYVLSYNEEMGKDIYTLEKSGPHINYLFFKETKWKS